MDILVQNKLEHQIGHGILNYKYAAVLHQEIKEMSKEM